MGYVVHVWRYLGKLLPSDLDFNIFNCFSWEKLLFFGEKLLFWGEKLLFFFAISVYSNYLMANTFLT